VGHGGRWPLALEGGNFGCFPALRGSGGENLAIFSACCFFSCYMVCYYYNRHTMKEADRKRVSQLRREAFALMRECEALLTELARPGRMIAGSFYGMRKKCGRAGCRCARGELHGPFPVISISRSGRRSTRSVPRDRADEVRSKAEAYARFQKGLTSLRRKTRRITEIVAQIREACLEDLT